MRRGPGVAFQRVLRRGRDSVNNPLSLELFGVQLWLQIDTPTDLTLHIHKNTSDGQIFRDLGPLKFLAECPK